MSPRAVILGGSIAGLFMASALKLKGWSISIHEKVSEPLSSRGAGIVTYKELAELISRATNHSEILGTSSKTRVSVDKSGFISNKFSYPQIFTSWQHIFSLLRSGISDEEYFNGDECVSFSEEKNKVISKFSNGKSMESELAIIATGIRSKLRPYVDKKSVPKYAGYIAWRGMVNETSLSEHSLKLVSNYFAFALPIGQQFLAYPVAGEGENAFSPGNRRINWIWYKPADSNVLEDLLTNKSGKLFKDGIPPYEIRSELISNLLAEARQKLAPQLIELIEKTTQPLIQPIFDLQSNNMYNNRIILTGDAAFTARPHAAMGVTKAGIDAFTLSHVLSSYSIHSNNLDSLLQKWEKDRIQTGKFLINRSKLLGEYLFTPPQNEKLVMPETEDVMKQTAISVYDIEDYPKSSIQFLKDIL